MFREEIDYFHAPKVSLKVVFAVWRKKIAQRRRCTGALCNGLQKLRRWLRYAVIAQQRFAQGRWFPSWSRDLFMAVRTECTNDFIDQFGVVAWINRQSIAHFKAQPPSRQIDFEMACILLRLRAAEAAVDDKTSRKRV